MKILMLGWELPPYNSGGLGVACYQLAKALAHEGAAIEFVLPAHAQHDDPVFMKVLKPQSQSHTTVVFDQPGAYTGDIEAVRRVQVHYESFVEDLVRKKRPDVIHAHDWLTLGAGVKAKLASGAPLIAHVHATEFDRSGGSSGNPLIHEIEQTGLLMADHVVAVSEATKRVLVRRYAIPAEKIEVIHNSSEELPYHVTERQHYKYIELLKNEGYIVVATVGRLTVQKGMTHFLRAAAMAHKRFSRFVFLVTGDGDQRDELIALTADLGISDAVLFTGFVRGKAWRDVYNLADVFVMSSISEPFGLTALEAAQHHTAIALSNQSGVAEVLSNSLRYDYWDEHRLADQLVALALSPSLRAELATNAFIEVQNMSWSDVATRFTSRYKSLKGASV